MEILNFPESHRSELNRRPRRYADQHYARFACETQGGTSENRITRGPKGAQTNDATGNQTVTRRSVQPINSKSYGQRQGVAAP